MVQDDADIPRPSSPLYTASSRVESSFLVQLGASFGVLGAFGVLLRGDLLTANLLVTSRVS